MTLPKLLIGCDKKVFGGGIRKLLETIKMEVRVFSLDTLHTKLAFESPDAVLMVAEDSIKQLFPLIEAIKQFDDNLPIIVLSPSKNIEEAVNLMKLGVFDYLTSPPDPARLQMTVQNALRLYKLTKRVFLLENQLGATRQLDEMIGSAPSMQSVFQMIQNVAKTSATSLILGESGTGKELVAKAIHRLSGRKDRRFIDINCGAIPQGLLENELFGHERGSYTGADRQYIGCCERADGGTLFLDEISEMNPLLQVKLLRFLQERQFMRVGGTQPINVDVRILAASNRNLADAVSKNQFREDLYYRLNVVSIVLPPLRERREDIPLLAKHFLEKYAHKNEKIFLDFTPEAMEALINYNWPGNIRELENTVERAVVLHNDTKIKLQYLPPHIQSLQKQESRTNALTTDRPVSPDGKVLPLTLVERYAIEAALKACTGNVAMAAKRLKIGQATLYRKIKHYGIRA
ncbi:MAG: sigma-54-dependent Fis family transcriptional regulator [Deltaproteobacteria bacterium]|nr:sigma-54-dependent Fis family transcriptional regulator [Deltaproteobacteria bacterium]